MVQSPDKRLVRESRKLAGLDLSSDRTADELVQAIKNQLDAAVATAIAGVSSTNWIRIVMTGQSLKKGQNTDYDAINVDVPDPRIFKYEGSGGNQNTVQPYSEPIRGPISAATGLGPAGALVKRLIPKYPPNTKFLIIQCAEGGVGFRTNGSISARWKVGSTAASVNLADRTVTMVNAAGQAINAPNSPIFFFWGHGESDAQNGISTEDYAADTIELVSFLRSNIVGAEQAPWVMSPQLPERIAAVPSGANKVQNAQIDLPRSIPLSSFYYPGPLGFAQSDNTHPVAAGSRRYGYMDAEALPFALVNRKGTPPVKPSSVTINGNDVSFVPGLGRATEYAVEYQSVAGGAWKTQASVAPFLRTTVTLSETPVRARVSSVNESGRSDSTYSASTTGGTVTPDPTPTPVDPISGITFDQAYDVSFKIVSGYTGPLGRVRRSTDNTEIDYNSLADVVAFVDTGSGYLSRLYDQSGNNRHLVQTDVARQPRLVLDGVTESVNGRASARFDRTDDGLVLTGMTSNPYASGAFSASIMQKKLDTTATAGALLGYYNSASTSTNYELPTVAANYKVANLYVRNNANGVLVANVSTDDQPYAFDPDQARQLTVIDTGTEFRRRVAKTALPVVTYTRSGVMTLDTFSVGIRLRNNGAYSGPRDMNLSSILISWRAWTDTERDKIEAHRDKYFSLS